MRDEEDADDEEPLQVDNESASLEDVLADLSREQLVEGNGADVRLTEEGRRAAELIVRRHRLAERLLTDVLEIQDLETETSACKFEHILSPEVTESICTLLGHPVTCPHGRRIPPGRCCLQARENLRPVVLPLSALAPGEEGRVAYIATHHHQRLDRLTGMGLVPGVKVRLHQRQPSFVIQFGETQLAVDQDVASDIYIRRASEEEGIRDEAEDHSNSRKDSQGSFYRHLWPMRRRRARGGPPDR